MLRSLRLIVSSMTQSLLVAALRYAERYPSQDGVALTPIAGFAIVRETQPSALQYSVSKPLVALSLQGTKRVTLGTNTLDFGVGESLLIITDVPTFSQITGASLTAPYVSLVVELDAAIIESPVIQMGSMSFSLGAPVRVDHTVARQD
ncbi:AraC family transcriptional regulator [Acidisoma sp. S159]|uniref:AraC family transcriptional regulator n=1 Tax=Acidisoma sp. S159 TaxID=1747225 RepID=UPI001C2094E7|nr:AraC family transcriptional regulator [Acidisoma sp. S159]